MVLGTPAQAPPPSSQSPSALTSAMFASNGCIYAPLNPASVAAAAAATAAGGGHQAPVHINKWEQPPETHQNVTATGVLHSSTKYHTEMKWSGVDLYQLQFSQGLDSYPPPIDPYPSTSIANFAYPPVKQPDIPACYYQNASAAAAVAGMLPGGYPSPYPAIANPHSDYFHHATAHHVAQNHHPPHNQWKISATNEHRQQSASTKAPLPYRTGPGTNNVRVRTQEKYRMVYDDQQRLELEKEFHTHAFITAERKSQLSTELALTERQIKIWFQNRRAKDRREKLKIHPLRH